MKAEDICSIDAEAGVIATLIHHPDYLHYSEYLAPNHFIKVDNQYIYAAINNLVLRKGIYQIDAFNLMASLQIGKTTKKFADEVSIDKINELIDMSGVIARDDIEGYKQCVDQVMNASFRREVFKKLKDCQAMCYAGNEENIQQKIYETIDDVMMSYSVSDDIPELGKMIEQVWDDIRRHQDGTDAGIPFKFNTLNEYVTLEPGELVVLGAPAKGAKSMFMLNEAVDILKRGKTVMYIDSELSTRLFTIRMLSHLTGIEFNRIRRGNYSQYEQEMIYEQLDWIKEQKLIHIYMPIFDQQSIYTAVKKAHHRFGKLDVLIVDYLKSTGDADAYVTYAELGKLVDMIKNDIAGSMDIAALAAAQLTSSGKLADSAKIARNASTIMVMLDKTPEEIAQDGPQCGNKKLVVQLNRNGMQHAPGEWIDINFNGNVILLEEARQHVPIEPY